jgi:hypothetical protein
MNNKSKCMLVLLVLIILCFTLAPLIRSIEGFKNQNLPAKYPVSVEKPILNDYPFSGRHGVSNDSASKIWWHYPIFSLPSYEQITNNLRYRYNPDNGTCSRSEFCGALYDSIKTKSNEVYPLPPAKEGNGARVGYFRSDPNLLYYSIPTNENILY